MSAPGAAPATAAPFGAGGGPESVTPRAEGPQPTSEKPTPPKRDGLGIRLARWAKRAAASPLAGLQSLASGRKDKAIDAPQTAGQSPVADVNAHPGDTLTHLPGSLVTSEGAGPNTVTPDASRATEKVKSAEEQKMDKALELDRGVDLIIDAAAVTGAEAQKQLIQSMVESGNKTPQKLQEAVHHGRRHIEIAKALEGLAQADAAFGAKLATARATEQQQRMNAYKAVGIIIGPNKEIQAVSGGKYEPIAAKLNAPNTDAQAPWQEALQTDPTLVKTLALHHGQDLPFAKDAFDVVRVDMQKAEQADIEATNAEINRLFDRFAQLPPRSEQSNLVNDPQIRRAAERFVGYFHSERQLGNIEAIAESALALSRAQEAHQNAIFQLESAQLAQEVLQRHGSLKDAKAEVAGRLKTPSEEPTGDDPEKKTDRERELTKLRNAQVLLTNIEAQINMEPPLPNETPDQKAQRIAGRQREILGASVQVAESNVAAAKVNLQQPKVAFDAALNKVPQKENNQFFQYLANLPNLLQRYPQMAQQMEQLTKIGIRNKRLKPLLITMIVLLLGATPLTEELQKMMRIQ